MAVEKNNEFFERTKQRIEASGIEIRELNYGALKAMHEKGINITDPKEDEILPAMMDCLIKVYPDEKEQEILLPFNMKELQVLFRLVMDKTQEAETGN